MKNSLDQLNNDNNYQDKIKPKSKLKLGNRLMGIVGFVKKGSVVADIGTDHGYLAVYLAINNISPVVYACDISKKPLEQAKNTVNSYKISDKVKTILSDGLKNLREYFEVINTIILAGMGENLIFKIITEVDFTKNKKINIIAQPMTGHEVLRFNLYKEGFYIKEEKLVVENKKLYTIMNIGYSSKKIIISSLKSYTGEILNNTKNDSEDIKRYFKNITSKLSKRKNGLKSSKIISKKINDEINSITKLIDELKMLY